MDNKVVLAYSGGLDTSVAIKWLKEQYDLETIAVLIDCGQPEDLNEASQRALDIGAIKAVIIDAKDDFINDYVWPSIRANVMYEKKYPLATALARPLIVEKLVGIAKKEGANTIAHGCTGKGNDQVRFDVGIRSLDPDINIIAPLREWKMSREEEIDYAKAHSIKVNVSKEKIYSIDENLWGRSIECGLLEDPYNEPPEDIYKWTKIKRNPSDKEYIEIGFEKGIPVSINGKNNSALEIIKEINTTAGSYGIGRVDMVENRLIGIKSREIYESPAAIVILAAHRELESLVLDRELTHYKYLIEERLSELIYYGLWFTPLKDCLMGFVDKSQESVNGTVRIRLEYKNFSITGRKSPNSLYDYGLATYDKKDQFDPRHSESFIRLWGFPYEIMAKKRKSDG
jgi:argininosuccinate synthase